MHRCMRWHLLHHRGRVRRYPHSFAEQVKSRASNKKETGLGWLEGREEVKSRG